MGLGPKLAARLGHVNRSEQESPLAKAQNEQPGDVGWLAAAGDADADAAPDNAADIIVSTVNQHEEVLPGPEAEVQPAAPSSSEADKTNEISGISKFKIQRGRGSLTAWADC